MKVFCHQWLKMETYFYSQTSQSHQWLMQNIEPKQLQYYLKEQNWKKEKKVKGYVIEQQSNRYNTIKVSLEHLIEQVVGKEILEFEIEYQNMNFFAQNTL